MQNICITFVQRQSNVFDVSPTLYKCYTNVLFLLGDYLVEITIAIRDHAKFRTLVVFSHKP